MTSKVKQNQNLVTIKPETISLAQFTDRAVMSRYVASGNKKSPSRFAPPVSLLLEWLCHSLGLWLELFDWWHQCRWLQPGWPHLESVWKNIVNISVSDAHNVDVLLNFADDAISVFYQDQGTYFILLSARVLLLACDTPHPLATADCHSVCTWPFLSLRLQVPCPPGALSLWTTCRMTPLLTPVSRI